MAGCWLNVGKDPEGPVTSQLDEVFPWHFFSSIPEYMLS
jgi:hypothetical protein